MRDSVRSRSFFKRIGRWLLDANGTDARLAQSIVAGIALLLILLGGAWFQNVWKKAAAARAASRSVPRRAADAQPARVDSHGDPLPLGALMRLGSLRYRLDESLQRIAMSLDGSRIVAETYNRGGRRLSLFDRKTGRLLRQLSPVLKWSTVRNGLAFAPEGNELLAVGGGGVASWNVESGQQVWSLDLERNADSSLALSRDGKWIAIGGAALTIWDRASRRPLHRLVVRDEAMADESQAARFLIGAIAFSPDGRFVVGGAMNATIYVWDLISQKEIARIPRAHGETIVSLAVTPDGKEIISGGYSADRRYSAGHPEIRFWNLATGARVREFHLDETIRGAGGLALSADGNTLISDTSLKTLFWDIAAGRVVDEVPTPSHWNLESPSISSDGSITATAIQRTIQVWDKAGGKAMVGALGHEGPIERVTSAPDGKLIYTLGQDLRILAWDADSGRLAFEALPNSYRGLAVSSDSRLLGATAQFWSGKNDSTPRIQIVDARNGKLQREFAVARRDLEPIAFSPNGRLLALGARFPDDGYDVCDLETGKETAELKPEHDQPWWAGCHHAAFAADGKGIYIYSNQSVQRWDIPSGKLTKKLRVSDNALHNHLAEAVFTPDARTLVTAGKDSLISWDLETGSIVSRISAPWHDQTEKIAISPDGNLLATRSGPIHTFERIHIFDRSKRAEVLTFDARGNPPTSLAFSADGKRLISGMADGTALVWDLSPLFKKAPAVQGAPSASRDP